MASTIWQQGGVIQPNFVYKLPKFPMPRNKLEDLKEIAPVIEYNLARCDDDGDGNDENDGEADV